MDKKRAGFTLIELLVVIAIIAILAAILFPVFASAKLKAQQTQCMGNMNQIGRAIIMYADNNNGCTPFAYNNMGGSVTMNIWDSYTWRERIQPYIKSKSVFICPIMNADQMPANKGKWGTKTHITAAVAKKVGHYGLNLYISFNDAGSQGGYRQVSTIPLPSKTIMNAENFDGDWSAEPLDNEESGSNTGKEGQFYPYHGAGSEKGGVFTFCDGHASFMSVYKTQSDNFYYWHVVKVKS